jgi:type VI secretion system protein ImpA
MPLADYLDLESLRTPPASGGPAGVDLRVDEEAGRLWREARDWRAEARQIERDADIAASFDAAQEGPAGRPPDKQVSRAEAIPKWQAIGTRTAELLRDRSRDLTVAALLIESLARTDGFGGIADGCDVARLLVEGQWNDLFPVPDPEDGPADEAMTAAERVLPLVQLVGDDADGLLLPAVLQLPLVDGRDGQRFGLGHWRIGQAAADPAADFSAAAAASEPTFLRETFQGIGRARAAWDALSDAVATASDGRAVLPALPLRQLFEECQDAMRSFAAIPLADLLAVPAAESLPSTGQPQSPGDLTHGSVSPPSGVLVSVGSPRHDVLTVLDSAADYFEHHDPHSLIAAQIRNVVRMARLPRTEYFQELIVEEPGLQSLARLTGLKFEGRQES